MARIGIKSRCMEYTLHGHPISDPWIWLEDLDSPETRAWVEAQNRRTISFLETIPQREEIRQADHGPVELSATQPALQGRTSVL